MSSCQCMSRREASLCTGRWRSLDNTGIPLGLAYPSRSCNSWNSCVLLSRCRSEHGGTPDDQRIIHINNSHCNGTMARINALDRSALQSSTKNRGGGSSVKMTASRPKLDFWVENQSSVFMRSRSFLYPTFGVAGCLESNFQATNCRARHYNSARKEVSMILRDS